MNNHLASLTLPVATLITLMLCLLVGTSAVAHPGSGIVVSKKGEIFFTDTGRGVWKIDTLGKLTYVPASQYHWMAIDESGYFAKSQKNFGNWFERIKPQGSKPQLILCSDFPITVNRDGNLYYADTRTGSPRLVRRTPEGKESVIAADVMFQGVSGIAAGPDGSLYVTDASHPNANAIRRITTDGNISMIATDFVIVDSVKNPPPDTPPGLCRGLDVDSAGVVYVAATGCRRVVKIAPRAGAKVILESPEPWSPTGVTVFRGEVYVLEYRDAPPSQTEVRKAWIPRVRKIARDGTITTLATVSR